MAVDLTRHIRKLGVLSALVILCARPVGAEPILYALEGNLTNFALLGDTAVVAAPSFTQFSAGMPFQATLLYEGIWDPAPLAPSYPFKALALPSVLTMLLGDQTISGHTAAVRVTNDTATGDQMFFRAGCCEDAPRSAIAVDAPQVPGFTGFELDWELTNPIKDGSWSVVPPSLQGFSIGRIAFQGVVLNPDKSGAHGTTVDWSAQITSVRTVPEPSSLALSGLGMMLICAAQRRRRSSPV